ncbi:MAG: ATP-binding cassette domain-containing protein, partial [Actinomycetia bacterium]|nr:ATP-binding cassette domain-containing protein [Actinomycetes bacterium]
DNTSVLRNLLEAVGAKPRRSRPTRADCEQALEQVGLEGRGPDPTYQLSGGEQQRVALARLIVRRPSLVLADEPTGALDHANADMVINTLRDFARAGATVLIATHSDRVVAGCDREFSLV